MWKSNTTRRKPNPDAVPRFYKCKAKNTLVLDHTDDPRALPELQTLVDTRVAISPIVLKALVQRNAIEREDAKNRLEELAETRDWLGAPIYRRAQQLFY